MELCPHSLRDIRKSLKTMPLSLIAHYARGVLSGLRYLHDQHIVHRDIKAANILVTDQGVVKVSDFGVSVTVADDEDGDGDAAGLEESENLGSPGSRSANAIKRRILCGTPCFIAPELFNGASCSEASDIWSFGCLMVELASGSSPWWNYPNHNGLWQIARRLRAGVAPTLPKTPAQAAALRMAASATGISLGSNSIEGAAAPEDRSTADAAASGALISGLQSLPSGSLSGQPHPALLDMGAPLTCVEGATEATPAFEDFVAQCLAFDTCRRPTAAALLAHPFLNSRA
jgi:serine/threonine protein kinase